MNGAAKMLLTVVAFVVAFAAVQYGLEKYREQKAVSKAEESLQRLKSEGAKNHPNLPTSEAMQQEAISMTSAKLNAESDKTRRLQTAASNFFGFFLVNTRQRPEYCREHGVDIAPFVSAFEQGHRKELAKARAALSGTQVDDDKLYAMLKPQFRQIIDQDMKDIAAANNASIKQACELIATNGQALAQAMHLSKIQPAVYGVLSADD